MSGRLVKRPTILASSNSSLVVCIQDTHSLSPGWRRCTATRSSCSMGQCKGTQDRRVNLAGTYLPTSWPPPPGYSRGVRAHDHVVTLFAIHMAAIGICRRGHSRVTVQRIRVMARGMVYVAPRRCAGAAEATALSFSALTREVEIDMRLLAMKPVVPQAR